MIAVDKETNELLQRIETLDTQELIRIIELLVDAHGGQISLSQDAIDAGRQGVYASEEVIDSQFFLELTVHYP